MARPAPIVSSPLAADVDTALATLTDPRLTAESYVKSIIKQISELAFPNAEREFAMKSELTKFAQHVRDLRLNDDSLGLRRAAALLQRSAQALARPIPAAKPIDIVRSYRLQDRFDWGSGTIELLIDDLKAEDLPLGQADRKGIQTATRRIDIEDLISRSRPRAMTNDHFPKWRASMLRPSFLRQRPSEEDQR